MKSWDNTKQRNKFIQGLRSFKDTLPLKVKRVITKKGHVFSKILDNWKYIVGEDLFDICFPKSFKSKNQLKNSQLLIFVKRGREVEVEYEKKKIISKINTFFGEDICGGIKIIQFEDEDLSFKKNMIKDNSNKFFSKIKKIKNEKIRKSLLKLSKKIKIK